MKASRMLSVIVVCSFLTSARPCFAAPVYIKNFSSFPAYAYNTTAYKQGGALVGCGPTTGAMIMGYFHAVHNLSDSHGLLTNPVSGNDRGLNTAWALHGASYMQTQANGFGSVYRIEPGLEGYALSRSYSVKAVIHASPFYANPSATNAAWLNDYGPFGDSWTNDGIFWRNTTDGKWSIDKNDFCNFVDAKLAAGIAIFLTIDTDQDKSGDHWVPLIGFDRTTLQYAFYNTYDQSVHWADIYYCGDPAGAHPNSISMLRTVTYTSPDHQSVNPPTNLIALRGYSGAIPLAWNAPATTAQIANLSKAATMVPSSQADWAESFSGILQSDKETITLISPQRQSHLVAALVDGYNMYRSTSASSGFTCIANGITQQYYRDSDIDNGQTYYYKVTAVSGANESNFSEMASATAAQNGYAIQSGWAATVPSIDGTIGTTEWSSAPKTSILYPGYSGSVTLYCMNNEQSLYIAVDDGRDTQLDNLDQVALFFDDNLDREWPSTEPSSEGNIWLAWNSSTNAAFSLFGPRRGVWPTNLIWDTRTTPAGVTVAISAASGHLRYESVIDLSASPLNGSPGATIGLLIFTYDQSKSYFNSFWPQEAERLKVITENVQMWGQAPFSFGDLRLAPLPDKKPDISITPATWNYGSVLVNGFKDKTFVLKNEGTATLNISSITLGGDISQFDFTSSGIGTALSPGSSRNFIVRFRPTSIGAKKAKASIHSNDPDESPLVITLTGSGSFTDVAQSAQPPQEFQLAQNYPNPFNATTTINSQIPFAGRVRLAIFDAMGRSIRLLCDEEMPAGFYSKQWDGRNQEGEPAASGVYFYQLEVLGEQRLVDTKKMIVMK